MQKILNLLRSGIFLFKCKSIVNLILSFSVKRQSRYMYVFLTVIILYMNSYRSSLFPLVTISLVFNSLICKPYLSQKFIRIENIFTIMSLVVVSKTVSSISIISFITILRSESLDTYFRNCDKSEDFSEILIL